MVLRYSDLFILDLLCLLLHQEEDFENDFGFIHGVLHLAKGKTDGVFF